jgi:hypothetical protein
VGLVDLANPKVVESRWLWANPGATRRFAMSLSNAETYAIRAKRADGAEEVGKYVHLAIHELVNEIRALQAQLHKLEQRAAHR